MKVKHVKRKKSPAKQVLEFIGGVLIMSFYMWGIPFLAFLLGKGC